MKKPRLCCPGIQSRNNNRRGTLDCVGYIDAGQDTLYFQKFDVKSDSTDLYSHQYAQNVMMAYSESLRYYNSYNDIGMIGQEFEFDIPVYNNMPEVYGYLP